MIDRIYISQKVTDNREKSYLRSFAGLGLTSKIRNVKIVDCYLISHSFENTEIEQIATSLTNPILERHTINDISKLGTFNYVIEISFLPGVTDNVGNTTKETIRDLLSLNNEDSTEVYSSKVFFITGNIKIKDVEKIALSLHNPLIEKALVLDSKKIKLNKNKKNLPLQIPKVNLKDKTLVLKVSLDVLDEELVKIGREGILGPNGIRRGPLALTLDSMKVIQAYFQKIGRDPSDIEIESLAQTWSEHCKHTIFANPIDNIKDGLYKTYIKGATNLIRKNKGKEDFCVSVFNDNSGAVDFDEDFLITHKVETHNAPSFLDPFGGSITSIVGVNRDAIGFGLGAKPIANTYGFCVGQPEDKRFLFLDKEKKRKMLLPKRILNGVIKGINSGGNCSGIPTLNGFVRFDDRYRGRPLVFAGTIGLIPRNLPSVGNVNRPSHEKSAEAGDYIVVVGGRVGADGIHGATFSSVTMDSGSPATAVQIGDPITQKKLSDALIKEARDMNLYNSITDNGAGGISCSVAEMARECGGAIVNLEKVPLKYPGLDPWQIWISESQERMTLAIPKKKWEVFKRLMDRRGVEAKMIGEFTNDSKCIVNYEGRKIMDLEMEFLHDGLPKTHLKTDNISQEETEVNLKEKKDYTADLLNLASRNNISSFAFISEQYDHEVQASSVLKPLSGAGMINTDAQVFHPVLDSNKGAVVSSALYPSYGDISTYHMAACAIDTTIRNIISAGGTLKHLSILDNFCWCSSYDKVRLAQLVDSVKACYDYAIGYGTPFISGKDSMFNDFKGYDDKANSVAISIPPTLLISGISVVDNILKSISPEFKNGGDFIFLIGETYIELGGGEYLNMIKQTGGNVPKVDFKKNIKIYNKVEELIRKEVLESSMSVTSGGLAMALTKASVGGMFGANIDITKIEGDTNTPVEKLFSESQGRILVSVSPAKLKVFEKMVNKTPYTKLGQVNKDGKFIIKENNKNILETKVAKLYNAYHSFSNQMK